MLLNEGIVPDRFNEFEYFPVIIDRLLSLLPTYNEEFPAKRRYFPQEFKMKLLKNLDGKLMTFVDEETLAKNIENQVDRFLKIYNFTPQGSPSTSFRNPFQFGFKKTDIEIIRNFVLDDKEMSFYLKGLEQNHTEEVISLYNYFKEYISLE